LPFNSKARNPPKHDRNRIRIYCSYPFLLTRNLCYWIHVKNLLGLFNSSHLNTATNSHHTHTIIERENTYKFIYFIPRNWICMCFFSLSQLPQLPYIPRPAANSIFPQTYSAAHTKNYNFYFFSQVERRTRRNITSTYGQAFTISPKGMPR
jgi:hypothetical protein